MEEKKANAAPETAEAKAPETAGTKPKKQITKSGIFIMTLSALLFLGVVWSMARAAKEQYESELDATYESMANSMFAVRNLISF